MARGGINKALVQKARAALLARGVNPSIDAVRVELGNTGSKTTISRYLQELEATDTRPQSDPNRLSDELIGIVDQLLKRLLEEGMLPWRRSAVRTNRARRRCTGRSRGLRKS